MRRPLCLQASLIAADQVSCRSIGSSIRSLELGPSIRRLMVGHKVAKMAVTMVTKVLPAKRRFIVSCTFAPPGPRLTLTHHSAGAFGGSKFWWPCLPPTAQRPSWPLYDEWILKEKGILELISEILTNRWPVSDLMASFRLFIQKRNWNYKNTSFGGINLAIGARKKSRKYLWWSSIQS